MSERTTIAHVWNATSDDIHIRADGLSVIFGDPDMRTVYVTDTADKCIELLDALITKATAARDGLDGGSR